MGACVSKRARPRQRGNSTRPPARRREDVPYYIDPDTTATSPDRNATGDQDEFVPTPMGNQHQQQTRGECVSVYTDWTAISPTRVSATRTSDTSHNETVALFSQGAETSTKVTTDNSSVQTQHLIEDDHYDVINDAHLRKIIDSKDVETDETSKQFPDDSKMNKLDIYCTTEDSTAELNEHDETTESSERERCKYENMVKVFQPLIVKNLIVHDVLPHLTFLEDEGRILAAEQRSPHLAVMYLLEEMEKSKEVRKWKLFMSALEKSGYEYIVQNIRGTHAIDNTYQVYYLRTLRAKLSRMMIPRVLLPRLCTEDIITDNTRQEIEQEETNHGRISAALLLLDRIPRKGTFWYRKFVQVLREENMDEVADNLEIPEVMNCTNQSFRPAAKPPTPVQLRSANASSLKTAEFNPPNSSETETYVEPDPMSFSPLNIQGSRTVAINSSLDPPAVDINISQLKTNDHFTEKCSHKNTSSFDTLNREYVTNTTIGSAHSIEELYDETEIYEEPDVIWPPVVSPGMIGRPVIPPPVINVDVNQPRSTSQNNIYKTYGNPDPSNNGSSAESSHESSSIGSVDIHDACATCSTIKIPVDYGLQHVLRKDVKVPVAIKPELRSVEIQVRSVEVQVDTSELSLNQSVIEEGYLEPSVIVNHSNANILTGKKDNLKMNVNNSTPMEQYEEPFKNTDSDKGTCATKHNMYVKHYPDDHQTLRNEIQEMRIESEKLKIETELLRQKCSISRERASLIKTKCELQKELDGTENEYQSLKQSLLKPSSKEVHEAESLEAEDELYKLYKRKTNHTNSVVSGSFRKTRFSSERLRRRPSINDWRRTAMRKMSPSFTGALFEQEFDFIDSSLEPTKTIKLFDFSIPKMTDHAAFSDVDSAVFSDFSAYNLSEAI